MSTPRASTTNPSSSPRPSSASCNSWRSGRDGYSPAYQIVDWTRGTDISVTERSVDVHIAALCRKLGRLREMIETTRGIGYRFKAL